MNLVRSHRIFGYESARARTAGGEEVIILQTAPHKLEAAPAHLVIPVSADEAVFEARMALAFAIERARFLGIDAETLRSLFDEEIARSPE